jgi:CRP/FNR family cyclic AMP-dependent transcriptional regulator
MTKKVSPTKAKAKKSKAAKKPAKKALAFDPAEFLATVKPGRTTMTHRKNGVIFSQGGPADAVFYVTKGKIKIVVASKQGKEAAVGILGSGEFSAKAV